MKTFKVPFLASSVIHWMNYVSAVGRNYIINESTIKIPVTEYLEVTGISPELEFGHPSFKQRRMDLKFKDSYANIDYAVEFKYVKGDSTRDLAERKRVFNDLMRLHFFLDTDRKGYFLICGIQEDFKLSFENLDLTPGYVSPKSKTAKKIKPSSFYSLWFSFDELSPIKKIELGNLDLNYKKVYDAFMDEYEEPYQEQTGTILVRPIEIQTKLIFLSQESTATNIPQTFKIGIWEVTK